MPGRLSEVLGGEMHQPPLFKEMCNNVQKAAASDVKGFKQAILNGIGDYLKYRQARVRSVFDPIEDLVRTHTVRDRQAAQSLRKSVEETANLTDLLKTIDTTRRGIYTQTSLATCIARRILDFAHLGAAKDEDAGYRCFFSSKEDGDHGVGIFWGRGVREPGISQDNIVVDARAFYNHALIAVATLVNHGKLDAKQQEIPREQASRMEAFEVAEARPGPGSK